MYPYNAQSAETKDEKGIIAAQNDVSSSSSEDINRILDLLTSAVSAKEKAAEKYAEILDMIYSPKDRETVRSIYLEELRGKKLLEQIKSEIEEMSNNHSTEETVETEKDETFPPEESDTLSGAFNNMITAEIESARFFRDLASVMEPYYNDYANTVLSIMNDDQNHAILDTMLYTQNMFSEQNNWNTFDLFIT